MRTAIRTYAALALLSLAMLDASMGDAGAQPSQVNSGASNPAGRVALNPQPLPPKAQVVRRDPTGGRAIIIVSGRGSRVK
ncbi:MAG: hypothetical protein JWN71_4061 [Xanthobacteraceae bacterium]|jgi:hypothetical protein|nr:hypothetical protein [Xanthobacteraceae bacterium]